MDDPGRLLANDLQKSLTLTRLDSYNSKRNIAQTILT